MKKIYATPEVDIVKFEYRDQVVAASGGCDYRHTGTEGCDDSSPFLSEG